ncbi:MAG: SAM-dependent methyltransferase [Litorimonas sp.]
MSTINPVAIRKASFPACRIAPICLNPITHHSPIFSGKQKLIFDPKAQALANMRARRRQARTSSSFLLIRAAEDAASRISDIARKFPRACLIGPFDARPSILKALAADKHPALFDYAPSAERLDGEYDLIISLLNLQSDEALPQTLIKFRNHLQPDGLFLGALFGGNSLTELRQTLYAVDQDLLGGAAARIIPMVDYSQCAALLNHAALALPVIDTDRFTVSYRNFQTLISDLRDLGLSNTLTARTKRPLPKIYPSQAANSYSAHFSRPDGKLQCQFEILWMCGWAPHDSQQKPLKPGSAKMRLGDALGAVEHKLTRGP